VKLVCIKPGAALSLQSNSHRSEPRAVVDGTAKVTIDDQEKLVPERQIVYVPLRSKHRL